MTFLWLNREFLVVPLIRSRAAYIGVGKIYVCRIHRGDGDDRRARLFRSRVVLDGNFDVRDRVGQFVVFKFGNDFRIDDGDRGLDVIINRPEDTAQAEEVLIFKVGTVGPAINLNRDNIFARPHGF